MRPLIPALLATILSAAPCPRAAFADQPPYASPDGYALGGHDAVAYFTRRAPVPGDRRFAVEWRGAVWLFESAASMTTFEMDPGRYAPRYGGYCAYAVSKGMLAPGDPEVFAVVGGRLYLNASRGAAAAWERDVSGNIAAADRNWPALVKP